MATLALERSTLSASLALILIFVPILAHFTARMQYEVAPLLLAAAVAAAKDASVAQAAAV
jgi:hypothetical protein